MIQEKTLHKPEKFFNFFDYPLSKTGAVKLGKQRFLLTATSQSKFDHLKRDFRRTRPEPGQQRTIKNDLFGLTYFTTIYNIKKENYFIYTLIIKGHYISFYSYKSLHNYLYEYFKGTISENLIKYSDNTWGPGTRKRS